MAKQSVGVWFSVLVCFAILVSHAMASADSHDGTALQDHYKALNYPGELKGWRLDGGTDPCGESWDGVSCSESSVIYLKLRGLNLSGHLHFQIFNLFNLRQLNIQDNDFSGSIRNPGLSLLSLPILWVGLLAALFMPGMGAGPAMGWITGRSRYLIRGELYAALMAFIRASPDQYRVSHRKLLRYFARPILDPRPGRNAPSALVQPLTSHQYYSTPPQELPGLLDVPFQRDVWIWTTLLRTVDGDGYQPRRQIIVAGEVRGSWIQMSDRLRVPKIRGARPLGYVRLFRYREGPTRGAGHWTQWWQYEYFLDRIPATRLSHGTLHGVVCRIFRTTRVLATKERRPGLDELPDIIPM